jgi:large subunit ribosomal protein L7/L12
VSSNVETLIDKIEKLTVLELNDLVKALEEKFGVTAAAPAVAVAAAPDDAGPKEEEKTEFEVVLASYGNNKIQVIRVVKNITGLGLKEAKDLVDNAPKTVKENTPKDEAEKIKKEIEEAGGSVELK